MREAGTFPFFWARLNLPGFGFILRLPGCTQSRGQQNPQSEALNVSFLRFCIFGSDKARARRGLGKAGERREQKTKALCWDEDKKQQKAQARSQPAPSSAGSHCFLRNAEILNLSSSALGKSQGALNKQELKSCSSRPRLWESWEQKTKETFKYH